MSRDAEHQEQVVFVRWLELCLPVMREHMTAVPHGGARHPAVAGKLKAEGVTAGYPDILVDLPRGYWHGLRIELKAKGGRPTPQQREWIERLTAQGYRAVVCVGADAAIEEAKAYWASGEFRAAETA